MMIPPADINCEVEHFIRFSFLFDTYVSGAGSERPPKDSGNPLNFGMDKNSLENLELANSLQDQCFLDRQDFHLHRIPKLCSSVNSIKQYISALIF